MPVTDAPSLSTHREEVRERLAAAPGLLAALDFDGTLAPIVEDPDDAEMAPTLRATLLRLVAREDVILAVVSGRELADVRERVAVDDAVYAGNHGLEIRRDDRTAHPAGTDFADAVDRVTAALGERLTGVPGCEIEHKGLTATVHVRRVPDDRVDEVGETVRDVVAEADADLELGRGKAVFEIRPAVDWDKGRAVERLAADVPDDWLSVYVGDDRTDEDAFAALDGGLAVLVGDREGTAADYRLPDHDGVADFLELVDDARAE